MVTFYRANQDDITNLSLAMLADDKYEDAIFYSEDTNRLYVNNGGLKELNSRIVAETTKVIQLNSNACDSLSIEQGFTSVVGGMNNTIIYPSSIVLGTTLYSKNSGQVVLGQYNSASEDATFIVGTGSSGVRQNAITAKTNELILGDPNDANFQATLQGNIGLTLKTNNVLTLDTPEIVLTNLTKTTSIVVPEESTITVVDSDDGGNATLNIELKTNLNNVTKATINSATIGTNTTITTKGITTNSITTDNITATNNITAKELRLTDVKLTAEKNENNAEITLYAPGSFTKSTITRSSQRGFKLTNNDSTGEIYDVPDNEVFIPKVFLKGEWRPLWSKASFSTNPAKNDLYDYGGVSLRNKEFTLNDAPQGKVCCGGVVGLRSEFIKINSEVGILSISFDGSFPCRNMVDGDSQCSLAYNPALFDVYYDYDETKGESPSDSNSYYKLKTDYGNGTIKASDTILLPIDYMLMKNHNIYLVRDTTGYIGGSCSYYDAKEDIHVTTGDRHTIVPYLGLFYNGNIYLNYLSISGRNPSYTIEQKWSIPTGEVYSSSHWASPDGNILRYQNFEFLNMYIRYKEVPQGTNIETFNPFS